MKFGIVAAMHEENIHLQQVLKPQKTVQSAGFTVFEGDNHGHTLVWVESGIGKVNAAMATDLLIRQFGVEGVLNSGSAGGIRAGCAIGDFVVADNVCHHDIDVTLLGLAFGELPELPRYYAADARIRAQVMASAQRANLVVHSGCVATGECFVSSDDLVQRIRSRFDDVIACEMEAAAVAQVCHRHGVPFAVIRCLSDIAGEDAEVDFVKHLQIAGQRSAELLLDVIAAL